MMYTRGTTGILPGPGGDSFKRWLGRWQIDLNPQACEFTFEVGQRSSYVARFIQVHWPIVVPDVELDVWDLTQLTGGYPSINVAEDESGENVGRVCVRSVHGVGPAA
jgi:hypothetical protein